MRQDSDAAVQQMLRRHPPQGLGASTSSVARSVDQKQERVPGDGPSARFANILIVDDDRLVLRMVARAVRHLTREICLASDGKTAESILEAGVDLLITDIRLGPGPSGVELAEFANMQTPRPLILAMTGVGDVHDGLALGRAGVGALVHKPFGRDALLAAIDGLVRTASPFEAVLTRSVGRRPMPEMVDIARRTMVVEALKRTGGNRARAASLLGISRQNLQKIIGRGDFEL